MSKNTVSKNTIERPPSDPATRTDSAQADIGVPPFPHKTKLEKTQSLLTVISTSIGLMGVAGSIFAFGLSTFYTGTVEVRPESDSTDVIVKVYTKEGHESTFHTKHIELMPGVYHLEIDSTDGRVVHVDTKIRFHRTNIVPVAFGKSGQQVNSAANSTAANTTATNNSIFSAPTQAAIVSTIGNSVPATASQNTTASQQQSVVSKPATGSSSATGNSPATGNSSAIASSNDGADATRKGQQSIGAANEGAADTADKKKHKWWQFWKHPIVDFGDAGDNPQ